MEEQIQQSIPLTKFIHHSASRFRTSKELFTQIRREVLEAQEPTEIACSSVSSQWGPLIVDSLDGDGEGERSNAPVNYNSVTETLVVKVFSSGLFGCHFNWMHLSSPNWGKRYPRGIQGPILGFEEVMHILSHARQSIPPVIRTRMRRFSVQRATHGRHETMAYRWLSICQRRFDNRVCSQRQHQSSGRQSRALRSRRKWRPSPPARSNHLSCDSVRVLTWDLCRRSLRPRSPRRSPSQHSSPVEHR